MTQTPSVIDKLSQVLEEAIHRHGWAFSMQGERLSPEEVVSKTGFLPLLLEMASHNASKALGDKKVWPSKYFYEGPALCQMTPDPDSLSQYPLSMMLLFVDHALETKHEATLKATPKAQQQDEIVVPLDDWMDLFIQRYNDRLIQLVTPSTPAPTAPASA